MINLINLCIRGGYFQVINNNGLTKGFSTHSGVKQGDVISPNLFVLCVDILIRAINNNPNLKGISPNHKLNINVSRQSTKILGYADDILLIGSIQDIKSSFQTIETFCKASGSKINLNKCFHIPINCSFTDCPLDIKIADSFDYLGLPFTSKGVDPNHWNSILNSIIETLNKLKLRNLCLLEKNHLLKAYALSHIWYSAPIIPIPTEITNKIENIMSWFLFSKKTRNFLSKEIIKSSTK